MRRLRLKTASWNLSNGDPVDDAADTRDVLRARKRHLAVVEPRHFPFQHDGALDFGDPQLPRRHSAAQFQQRPHAIRESTVGRQFKSRRWFGLARGFDGHNTSLRFHEVRRAAPTGDSAAGVAPRKTIGRIAATGSVGRWDVAETPRTRSKRRLASRRSQQHTETGGPATTKIKGIRVRLSIGPAILCRQAVIRAVPCADRAREPVALRCRRFVAIKVAGVANESRPTPLAARFLPHDPRHRFQASDDESPVEISFDRLGDFSFPPRRPPTP